MKKINELYLIKHGKTLIKEDNYGDRYGEVTYGQDIEYNYDDCINRYVSYCEDGYDCTYEKIDEAFTNSIKELDERFNLTIMKYCLAEKENHKLGMSILKQDINGYMDTFNILFRNFKLEIFDIDERFMQYYEKHKMREIEKVY